MIVGGAGTGGGGRLVSYGKKRESMPLHTSESILWHFCYKRSYRFCKYELFRARADRPGSDRTAGSILKVKLKWKHNEDNEKIGQHKLLQKASGVESLTF